MGAAGAGSARPASVAAGTVDSPARLEPQHVRRLPTEDTPHVCWNPADNVSHDVLTAHGGSATCRVQRLRFGFRVQGVEFRV